MSAGKILLIFGLFTAAIGVLVLLLERAGLFRLPGDVRLGGDNWKVYIPITSCIILSLLLTGLMWLVSYLRK